MPEPTGRELAQSQQGIGLCNITKCCTEVCPEHIKITDNAIIPLKERVVDRKYDPLVWLGNKIFRRTEAVRQTAQRGRGGRGRTSPSHLRERRKPGAGLHAPDTWA